MKHFIYFLLIISFLISCNTSKNANLNSPKEIDSTIKNDTVTISNDELEYEIIIIEPGFNSWLISNAKPRGFYSQTFLESRNQIYVTNWNIRVLQPSYYKPNLYEMQIDYQSSIDYGYEVNYLLYNYFIYFQLHYKQRLGPFTPRI